MTIFKAKAKDPINNSPALSNNDIVDFFQRQGTDGQSVDLTAQSSSLTWVYNVKPEMKLSIEPLEKNACRTFAFVSNGRHAAAAGAQMWFTH